MSEMGTQQDKLAREDVLAQLIRDPNKSLAQSVFLSFAEENGTKLTSQEFSTFIQQAPIPFLPLVDPNFLFNYLVEDRHLLDFPTFHQFLRSPHDILKKHRQPEGTHKVRIYVHGPPGIGKTDFVESAYERLFGSSPMFAQDLDFGVFTTKLLTYDKPKDLLLNEVFKQYEKSEHSPIPSMDAVILCYDLSQDFDMNAIHPIWEEGCKWTCRGAQKIILGLKSDLVADVEKRMQKVDQALLLKSEFYGEQNIRGHFFASGKTENVEDVLVKMVLNHFKFGRDWNMEPRTCDRLYCAEMAYRIKGGFGLLVFFLIQCLDVPQDLVECIRRVFVLLWRNNEPRR